MPWANLDRKREKQREWIAAKRARQKENRARQGSTTPKSPSYVGQGSTGLDKSGSTAHVGPKAINQPTPILFTTHRFEIRTEPLVALNLGHIPNIRIAYRGMGGRIKYGIVDLDNCFIEFHKTKIRLVLKSGHEIVNADPERVKSLYNILASVCRARGILLSPEATWDKGLYAHTVMVDNGLNAFFMPLAASNWGDEDLHFFQDESHTGKVEMGGRKSYDAADNLRFMLLEFPKHFAEYNANIVKHLAVLDEMSKGIVELRGAVQELREETRRLRK